MSDETGNLARRFPGQGAALRRLYMRDQAFRAICTDYNVALRAYQHWLATPGGPNDTPAESRLADYRKLMEELENETRERLAKDGSSH
jgi:hypothetical protein